MLAALATSAVICFEAAAAGLVGFTIGLGGDVPGLQEQTGNGAPQAAAAPGAPAPAAAPASPPAGVKTAPAESHLRILSEVPASTDASGAAVPGQYRVLVLSVPSDRSGDTLVSKGKVYLASKPLIEALAQPVVEPGAGSNGGTADMNRANLRMKSHFFGLKNTTSGRTAFAPKGTRFHVDGDRDGELSLRVTHESASTELRTACGKAPPTEPCPVAGATEPVEVVQEGPLYRVRKDQFPPDYWSRSGITYGPLFVPFKMRFKDKSLSGEAALGGYLGYEFSVLDYPLVPVVHAGLTVVTIGGDQSANKNVNDTTTKPAFTWGFGLVLKASDTYQAAVILGKDQIGGKDGAEWQYERKWWLSVAFGYNFAR